jgi:hypothetical protein
MRGGFFTKFKALADGVPIQVITGAFKFKPSLTDPDFFINTEKLSIYLICT